MDSAPIETLSASNINPLNEVILSEKLLAVKFSPPKLDKQAIRTSLKASTWDGVFATMFSSITGGVLLSNFLLQVGAGPMEIGMLSSVPMLVNLLQPLGAYLSEKTTSRRWYNLCIFGAARLLWLILVLGIGWNCWHHNQPNILTIWTLAIIWASNLLGALGSASWLSWMAALVPRRVRGRYFGFRNSVANLANLIGVPLLAVAVSAWPGGAIAGYGVVLLLGVVAGLISLGCQFFMADVNPQEKGKQRAGENVDSNSPPHGLRFTVDANYLKFLFYFGFWTFAVNISAPFFNLYMLDNLAIDVSWVTLYGSLRAGAGLLMLVLWGKLADRIGNRPIMILAGFVVALTTLVWMMTGRDAVSLWVWLPLLHVVLGGCWAALDLCSNNLLLAIAPQRHQATYLAIAAAVYGVCGALGTTTGGFLAEKANHGSLLVLFAVSAILRFIAWFPLFFVREPRSQPLVQVMRSLFPRRSQLVPDPATTQSRALTASNPPQSKVEV